MQVFITLALTLTILTAAPLLLAADTSHKHHGHIAELHLNDGEKWSTDQPLREAMLVLRTQLTERLDRIHNNKLAAEGYIHFSGVVEQQINFIVKNCKLAPEADAQFHLILARLINASSQMKDPELKVQRQGAIEVLQALQQYPVFFQDELFLPIAH
ncbi:hypothetical protein [Arsukibacterium indicum]|uniref:DnrO protein n=1 Tax=Arsukibacterium indicum TaxID=2848612 RepID=A0ABS6MFK0_9GAMM|nr:hypothetical protein [Arsukibacterium indicum]MBV2127596.1 hypothetical protein [Arsukibacterium indicum]